MASTAKLDSKLTEFHYFPKLPLELQDAVWKFAVSANPRPPSIIQVERNDAGYVCTFSPRYDKGIPAMLHTCQTSRSIMTKHLNKAKPLLRDDIPTTQLLRADDVLYIGSGSKIRNFLPFITPGSPEHWKYYFGNCPKTLTVAVDLAQLIGDPIFHSFRWLYPNPENRSAAIVSCMLALFHVFVEVIVVVKVELSPDEPLRMEELTQADWEFSLGVNVARCIGINSVRYLTPDIGLSYVSGAATHQGLMKAPRLRFVKMVGNRVVQEQRSTSDATEEQG